MSSSSDIMVALKSAQTYLFQFACPIVIFFGTIGCIINVNVFSQKNLRKNPCSIYFIAYNFANLIFIYSSLLSSTLSIGYNIDATIYNVNICRLYFYITLLFNVLSPFYLILASIDRILVTSPNALTRRRSTRRFAYLCIIIGTLFWALFFTHALIEVNIIQFAPNIFTCLSQSNAYLVFISYYSLIEEILAPSLLTICGLWSIKNIQSIRHVRAVPNLSVTASTVEGGLHSTSSKDRQLILMLLMDITIYAPFNFVFAIFLIYLQITQNYIKSVDQVLIENIISSICVFGASIPFCTSCYANLIVSKSFRKEVKKVISLKRIFCID